MGGCATKPLSSDGQAPTENPSAPELLGKSININAAPAPAEEKAEAGGGNGEGESKEEPLIDLSASKPAAGKPEEPTAGINKELEESQLEISDLEKLVKELEEKLRRAQEAAAKADAGGTENVGSGGGSPGEADGPTAVMNRELDALNLQESKAQVGGAQPAPARGQAPAPRPPPSDLERLAQKVAEELRRAQEALRKAQEAARGQVGAMPNPGPGGSAGRGGRDSRGGLIHG